MALAVDTQEDPDVDKNEVAIGIIMRDVQEERVMRGRCKRARMAQMDDDRALAEAMEKDAGHQNTTSPSSASTVPWRPQETVEGHARVAVGHGGGAGDGNQGGGEAECATVVADRQCRQGGQEWRGQTQRGQGKRVGSVS